MSIARARTSTRPECGVKVITRWRVTGGGIALVASACVWLVLTDAPSYQFLVRVSLDRSFLKQTLDQWGVWAPVIFIVLQALQVVVAPIPGEVTGILGGFLFGEWPGLLYSVVGTIMGSMTAFALGRWLGARSVRTLVSQETWSELGFLVKGKGAILCLIVYLVPGFPKDMACYLFGMSRMPLGLFVLISTLGRLPGTWVLSTQGAHAAAGNYLELVLCTVMITAAALPLYYYRTRIIGWVSLRADRQSHRQVLTARGAD